MEESDSPDHGWFLKGLEEASQRVKDLPDWAKDNSSAIEKVYVDRPDSDEGKAANNGRENESHSTLVQEIR
jgi:hypothetical protein